MNKIVLGFLFIVLTLYTPFTYSQSVPASIQSSLHGESKSAVKKRLLCTREIKLKPGVDPKTFEKWITEYWNPEWRDWIPGYESYVDKTLSDQEEPQYFYCLKFSSTAKGIHADDYVDWHRELIYYKPTKHLYDELFEYIELDPFFNNKTCREW